MDITVILGNITSMWLMHVHLDITKSVKSAICYIIAKFSCIEIERFMRISTVAYRLSGKVPAAGSEFLTHHFSASPKLEITQSAALNVHIDSARCHAI